MRMSYGRLFLTAIITLGLQACGGGGGGGGGALGLGGLPIAPIEPVSMTVSVNGKVISPSPPSNGRSMPEYQIKAGDKIEVTANQPVRWTPDDDHGFDEAIADSDYAYTNVDPRYSERGFLKFRNLSINSNKWSAQIVNLDSRGDQGSLITGISASVQPNTSFTDKQFSSFYLKVSAGDPRNGTYEFFSAGGFQKKLRLDFDAKAYELVGHDASKLTGMFVSDDKEPGTYVFEGKNIKAASNIARFRLAAKKTTTTSADMVVGALPPEDGASAQPFIAMAHRSEPLRAAALGGIYNRFGIERVNGATGSTNSAINQFSISADGSRLELCTDHYVFSAAGCSVSDLKKYVVTAGARVGFWRATNVADAKDSEDFFAMRMNGEVVVLSAGKLSANPLTSVFRLALPVHSPWRDVVAYGASTDGAWNKVTVSGGGSALSRDYLKSDGSKGRLDFSIKDLGNRSDLKDIATSAPELEDYIGIQSTNLSLLIGAPTPAYTGLLQINLNEQ